MIDQAFRLGVVSAAQFAKALARREPIIRSVLCIGLVGLAACAERTETAVPAFSGQVVDATNSVPLVGVLISEEANTSNESWRPELRRTDEKGRFVYPALTLGKVAVFGPGPGYPISRRLTFQAKGYQQRMCVKDTFSLFDADNEVWIGLQPRADLAPGARSEVMLSAAEMIQCDAQIGDTVGDGQKLFRIVQITENAAGETVLLVQATDGVTFEKRPFELTLVFSPTR